MHFRHLIACVLVQALLFAEPAAAQLPDGDARMRARTLANQGYEHYQAGRYADALRAFSEAERIYHAPTLLLMVARAYERLGRLLEAQAIYEKVVAEKMGPKEPAAFLQAQQTARQEISSLKRRIPAVQVLVTGAPAGDVVVTVDGSRITAGGPSVPHNPGRADVVVQAPGESPIEQTLNLQEGRTERITLHLGPSAGDPTASRRRGYLLPAGIAFGVAGAGLAAGTITGIIARIQLDDVESRCTDDGHCLISDQPKAEEATRLGTASTVTLLVGGVAAAAGITLLVLRPGGAPEGAPQAGATVLVGPGYAQIMGKF